MRGGWRTCRRWREFAREANADMGFKAIWWLAALMGENNLYDGKVWDYQAVWGTGNAIVELTPNANKEIEWEKEFDEGPAITFAEASGTGLETHNVAPSESSGSGGTGRAENEPTRAARPPSPRADARGDTVIRTDRAPTPVGPYPHARRVGSMLFLSGIGPRKPGTGEIPQGIEAQTRSAIENVRVILEEAGSSLEKVLDVTVYLTDMKRDFDRFNRIYAEYFVKVQPTRTTVGVDSLPTPIDVELKVIAAV